MISYTHKLQGDGSHSWVREEDGFLDMIQDIEVFTWKLKYILTEDNLISQVESAINNMPDPIKTQAVLAWNQSPKVSITSDTTKVIQQVIGLTIEEATVIFERAYNLDI